MKWRALLGVGAFLLTRLMEGGRLYNVIGRGYPGSQKQYGLCGVPWGCLLASDDRDLKLQSDAATYSINY